MNFFPPFLLFSLPLIFFLHFPSPSPLLPLPSLSILFLFCFIIFTALRSGREIGDSLAFPFPLIISHLCFFMIIHFPFYFVFPPTSSLFLSSPFPSPLSSLYSLCSSSLLPFLLSFFPFPSSSIGSSFVFLLLLRLFAEFFFFTTFCKIIL